MEKMTKEQLQKHLKLNCGDYNSMVSIAILYYRLYGEYPKIGMSGQQRDFAESMKDVLPSTKGE